MGHVATVHLTHTTTGAVRWEKVRWKKVRGVNGRHVPIRPFTGVRHDAESDASADMVLVALPNGSLSAVAGEELQYFSS